MEKKPTEQECQTFQEYVAAEVLAIAVAIQQHGKEKHNVSIGIDTAVQAASMLYCIKRAHKQWNTELNRRKPEQKTGPCPGYSFE